MTNNSVHVCSGDQTALSPGTNSITHSRGFKFCPETILHAFSAASVRAGRDFLPSLSSPILIGGLLESVIV